MKASILGVDILVLNQKNIPLVCELKYYKVERLAGVE